MEFDDRADAEMYHVAWVLAATDAAGRLPEAEADARTAGRGGCRKVQDDGAQA
jgi:hypothetical protein